MHITKWHGRYMELATMVAGWSKDPGSKVGAVAVGEAGQILSTGYNGFPRGVRDDPERLKDRDEKLKFTVHAETNCIYNCSLNGVSLRGSTVYVSGLPTCHECAKAIIQSGVTRLVVLESDINKSDRWAESWSTSMQMFREAEVEVMVLNGEEDE